jgi:2-hydroxychromene-2-carboxylate isomerase
VSALVRRLSPLFTTVVTHPRTRDARRWLAETVRRLSGAPHVVRYFHQVDDPYSHLAAQVLGRLRARYDIVLELHLVGPPPHEAAPERARLEAFSRKDAADVAPGYALDFPAGTTAPPETDRDLAAQGLAALLGSDRFDAIAPQVGDALWSGRRPALEKLAAEHGAASPEQTLEALLRGGALRRRKRHYLGAMFHYAGEWYWGVDRLAHLERRLQGLGLLRDGESALPIVVRPDPSRQPAPTGDAGLRLEYFPSLRSPYTAIAMRRVLALPKRLPVELVLRPVLPMVMRGLPVPKMKRLYILLDTKREAEDAGEPFGHACDPVGRPVERGFSLYPFAREQGRAAEYLEAFTTAAFSLGVDTGTDTGMRHVVERAGLSWREALPHLDGEGWREELEENRRVLFDSGLWGVPSFRLLDAAGSPVFCTWGQDRIWRVEEEIRRRLTEAPA